MTDTATTAIDYCPHFDAYGMSANCAMCKAPAAPRPRPVNLDPEVPVMTDRMRAWLDSRELNAARLMEDWHYPSQGHGTWSTYNNHGCWCGPCHDAARQYVTDHPSCRRIYRFAEWHLRSLRLR